MSEWRELAEVASDQIGYECRHQGVPDDSVPGSCPECWELGGKVADQILAAGYRKTRTITTAEELDALQVGSVILDPIGLSLHKNPFTGWNSSNGAKEIPADMLEREALPATVLHEPEVTK